jgi:transcriptional regulator with XRE-family HTH domain
MKQVAPISLLNATTFKELMGALGDHYQGENLTLKETAERIGISEKSYFDLKKGAKPPKTKLQRALRHFLEQEFGITYRQDKPDSFQIKIKQLVIADYSNVATGKNNTVNTGIVSEPKQMSYLLDRVMKLETDILSKDRETEKLREEIRMLKKKR